MVTYAIIHGKNLMVRQFTDSIHATVFCQNYLDQSKEIVLREIEEFSIANTKIKQQ